MKLSEALRVLALLPQDVGVAIFQQSFRSVFSDSEIVMRLLHNEPFLTCQDEGADTLLECNPDLTLIPVDDFLFAIRFGPESINADIAFLSVEKVPDLVKLLNNNTYININIRELRVREYINEKLRWIFKRAERVSMSSNALMKDFDLNQIRDSDSLDLELSRIDLGKMLSSHLLKEADNYPVNITHDVRNGKTFQVLIEFLEWWSALSAKIRYRVKVKVRFHLEVCIMEPWGRDTVEMHNYLRFMNEGLTLYGLSRENVMVSLNIVLEHNDVDALAIFSELLDLIGIDTIQELNVHSIDDDTYELDLTCLSGLRNLRKLKVLCQLQCTKETLGDITKLRKLHTIEIMTDTADYTWLSSLSHSSVTTLQIFQSSFRNLHGKKIIKLGPQLRVLKVEVDDPLHRIDMGIFNFTKCVHLQEIHILNFYHDDIQPIRIINKPRLPSCVKRLLFFNDYQAMFSSSSVHGRQTLEIEDESQFQDLVGMYTNMSVVGMRRCGVPGLVLSRLAVDGGH